MPTTNPVLVQYWRGEAIESIHRGAWALVDTTGSVHASVGDPDQAVFARSSSKSFQALPLIESGAADAFGLPTESLALALASHSGEPQHEKAAQRTLDLAGLTSDALRCGPQAPMGSAADAVGSRILNNCSGKHAGFLAVSQHLDADPDLYLHPDGVVQRMVRDAVIEITGADPSQVSMAIDGCSAPTFRMPLRSLATGIARVTNPAIAKLSEGRKQACLRMVHAATEHPELIAGSHQRICTDLISATEGRLFAKIGAEGVYFVGAVGADRGLAMKIDDGNVRAIYPLLIDILQRFDLITSEEVACLSQWTDPVVRNWDKQVVGHIELAP